MRINILSSFLLICFCYGNKTDVNLNKSSKIDGYTIYKIDSINNFYLVYATMSKKNFKIVSMKENQEFDCSKIQINGKYLFQLKSIWHSLPHITCLGFNDSTTICLERPIINDLFVASNLKGLCIIE